MPSTTPLTLLLALLLAAAPSLAHGQENYEIQVYGSQTMPVGSTMFELHSNYALDGRRTIDAGMLPTNHALHETVEITHGARPVVALRRESRFVRAAWDSA